MKNKLNRLLIFAFCISVCSGCSGSNSSPGANQNIGDKSIAMDNNYQTVDYGATILLIEKKAANNVSWDGLFDIKEFVGLYEHSLLYIDSAVQFFGREEFSASQKKICINSMQQSKLEDYIRFCEACKDLYDKGKIAENILEWAISPNFSNKHIIVRNYEKPVVVSFLTSIKSDEKISNEVKETVDEILSGKSLENLKEINGESN